jgi:hypothetical protein
MDFLDQKFVSVDRAEYAGFLGLGNKKKKASSSSQGAADLGNRFTFSDNCAEQKKIVAALQAESAQLLASRNSAKGSTRTELTGRLQAYDAYIPQAIAHMNNVSCLAPKIDPTTELNKLVEEQNATKSSNTKTYILAGVGLIVVIGAIILIKKLKK